MSSLQESSIACVILAAGTGGRLGELTRQRPKPLCPVNNVALIDVAIEHASSLNAPIAVNLFHFKDLMQDHLDGRVHLSVEDNLLGTAGAIGKLREWIDGRSVLIYNVDSWHKANLPQVIDGWDGERVRMMVVEAEAGQGDFGNWRFTGISLMPWSSVKDLEPVPSGLYDKCWKSFRDRDELDFFKYDGPYFDCGTPCDYLDANLAASGGSSVIGPGAVVEGKLTRSVVWPGARVGADESLVDSVRADNGDTVKCER